MDGSSHAIFKIFDTAATVTRPLRDKPDPLSINTPFVLIPWFSAHRLTRVLYVSKPACSLSCSDKVKKMFRAARLLLHLFVTLRADAIGSDVDSRNIFASSGVLFSNMLPSNVPPRVAHSVRNAFSKNNEGERRLYWRCFTPHESG